MGERRVKEINTSEHDALGLDSAHQEHETELVLLVYYGGAGEKEEMSKGGSPDGEDIDRGGGDSCIPCGDAAVDGWRWGWGEERPSMMTEEAKGADNFMSGV